MNCQDSHGFEGNHGSSGRASGRRTEAVLTQCHWQAVSSGTYGLCYGCGLRGGTMTVTA
jgi:hypothetical protein